MSWQTVIGLEVHVQLKTQSKLFSPAATAYGAAPNAQTSYIDAGLPGVLPVLNEQAVRMAVQFGLAISGIINNDSYFERKNYFYPDLPKGYQISQYKKPIVGEGYLDIQLKDETTRRIKIDRAHLEEDAGKSVHDMHSDYTGIDLNRAGTPLLEIVTAPCMHSAHEAVTYLKKLHQLVRFLGISDGNMQEGSFRCDVNLSLNKPGSEQLGTRAEIKNLNSFRFIEKAIAYETLRHQDILESGEKIIQETRLYSPESNATYSMRGKETDNDYRYFPDPDLLPIQLSSEFIKQTRKNMPILPEQLKVQLQASGKLSQEDIEFILNTPETVHFFITVQSLTKADDKLLINWLKGPVAATLNEQSGSFECPPISVDALAKLLDLIYDKQLASSQAKVVYEKLTQSKASLEEIIEETGFNQSINQDELSIIIEQIIQNHPQQVEELRSGKDKLMGFFVGQVMKQTKGQANPAEVNRLLSEKLKK